MKQLRKKREERFERELRELYQIEDMLKREGKSDGERRYCVFMATLFLFIDDSLRRIGLVLFCVLGFIIREFISGLF